MRTPHRRDPIEYDLCGRHIAVARGGDDGIDDLFRVVLHEPFGKNSRLVPRALRLPGRVAGLAFLKPVSKIWACIFSHNRKSFLKRERRTRLVKLVGRGKFLLPVREGFPHLSPHGRRKSAVPILYLLCILARN
jgi:hypothetical protein